MKRCPECRRDYYDETLLYCLDDGNALLDGPATTEPATALLSSTQLESQVQTRPQIDPTNLTAAPQVASSAEYIITQVRRNKWVVIFALMIILLGGAATVWLRWSNSKMPAGAAHQMKVTRLTSHGQVGLPAISPDGKYVIYTLWEAGKGSLWLRQVSSNSAVPLVQPNAEGVGYGGRTFSPNGEMIYYVSSDKDNERGSLFEIPTLGGTPRRVLTNIGSGITFAPDGRSFAFLRNDENQGSNSLMVASLDGGNERVLATRSGDEFFEGDPAWSPDGKTIECGAGTDKGGYFSTIETVSVDGGNERFITPYKWRGGIWQIAWLKDGSALLLSAAAESGGIPQIWSVSQPAGEARQLTNDVDGYGYVSVTSDSTTLVTRQENTTQRVWTLGGGEDASHAKAITNGKYDGGWGLAWTTDGKIVYTAKSGENVDLWIMNGDGSGKKQLNSDPDVDYQPAVTSDGRYIFFVSERGGGSHIWRMDADGGHVRQMTDGDASDGVPRCSPDGLWVTFMSWRSGKRTLWKIPVDGGEPVQVLDKPTGEYFFARDGKTLIWFFLDEQFNPPKRREAVVTFETGQILRVFDLPQNALTYGGMALGSPALLYTVPDQGVDNVWSYTIDGASSKQLTHFKSDPMSDRIFRFTVSADGKHLAMVRGRTDTDIILIKDFR